MGTKCIFPINTLLLFFWSHSLLQEFYLFSLNFLGFFFHKWLDLFKSLACLPKFRHFDQISKKQGCLNLDSYYLYGLHFELTFSNTCLNFGSHAQREFNGAQKYALHKFSHLLCNLCLNVPKFRHLHQF